MKTVWKFQLGGPLDGRTKVEMPMGASPIRVGMQGGYYYLWAVVDSEAPKEHRTFFITGTGFPVEMKNPYIGSFSNGPFEWHVWEK